MEKQLHPNNHSLPKHRSPCPVASCLDIMGDKWTLLIIRDLMAGRSRFKALMASPEKIASNLLSERLNRLILHGVIETVPSPDGTKHQAYLLTPKGKSLLPVLKAMREWGLKWIPDTEARIDI
jgi:DNA-binding HxlR family transcriptional regulator